MLEALGVRLVVEPLPAIGAFLGWRRKAFILPTLLLLLVLLLFLHHHVGAHMAVEVGAPGECPPALGTLEGFLTSVDAPMPLQMGTPGKSLPADSTLVGFAPQMALKVPIQTRRVGEAAAALRAAVGFLPTGNVGALVGEQRGADAETPPAVGAHIGPFARVHPLVDGEVGALDEGFAAVGAAVRAVAGVDFLVFHQGRFVAEALPAFSTRGAGLGLVEAWWFPAPALCRAARRTLCGFGRFGGFLMGFLRCSVASQRGVLGYVEIQGCGFIPVGQRVGFGNGEFWK